MELKYLKQIVEHFRFIRAQSKEYGWPTGLTVLDTNIYSSTEYLVALLIHLYYGDVKAEFIWEFIIDPNNSKFENINQLYEFISDPYSSNVSENPLTIKELKQVFSENDELINLFEKCIQNATTN